MFNRVLFFVGGVSFCGLGYQIITKGGWRSLKTGIYIYYSNIKMPAGILMIFVGLLLLIFSLIGKWQRQEIFICPKCEKTIAQAENKGIKCPTCDTKMESLKGFYDRHPDKAK